MTLKDHLLKTAQRMHAAGRIRFTATELADEARVESTEKSRADQTTSAYLGKLVKFGLVLRFHDARRSFVSYSLSGRGLRYRPVESLSPTVIRELQRAKERAAPRARKPPRTKEGLVLQAARKLRSQGWISFSEDEVAKSCDLKRNEVVEPLRALAEKGKLKFTINNFIMFYSFPGKARKAKRTELRHTGVLGIIEGFEEPSQEQQQLPYFALLLVQAVQRLERAYGSKHELDAFGDLVRLAYTSGVEGKVTKWMQRSWFLRQHQKSGSRPRNILRRTGSGRRSQ